MTKLPVLNNKEFEEFSFKSLSDFVHPIYMDNNATTKVDEDAIIAMMKTMEICYANPSGMHAAGLIVKQEIENARKKVADFIGCQTTEVIFTSGGTESINSVINSVIKTHYPKKNIISCVTEHGATLNKLKEIDENWAPKYNISYVDVDKNGNFLISQLESLLTKEPENNLLVSLMAANNETGTIHHNLFEAINLAHKYGALFHVDAVQIAGKLLLSPYIQAGTDFLTISGHKFHSSKGIGVLYVKNNLPFAPSFFGGYQEYSRRAGTENVPGIVALGVVASKMPQCSDFMKSLHKDFITMLQNRIPSIILNGGGVPGTINIGFKYVHREAMVAKLSQYDLYASVGSACANGIEPSHVLSAMQVPKEYIHGSVRFSFSKYTTKEEITRSIDIIERAYAEVRSYSVGIIP